MTAPEDLFPGALPGEWMEDASCSQTDPEVFFPVKRGDSARPAKRVCAGCPVVQECLEYALANGESYGVWGGKSPRELAQIRKDRRAAAGEGTAPIRRLASRDEKIIKARRSGAPAKEVAAAFGVSPSVVHGVMSHAKRMAEDGEAA